VNAKRRPRSLSLSSAPIPYAAENRSIEPIHDRPNLAAMIEPDRFFHRPTGRFDWTRQASSARAGVEEVEMIGCGEEVGEGARV